MPANESVPLSQRIADFIVKAEFDRQSLSSKEHRFLKQFEARNIEIDQQVQQIQSEISHFKSIMTRSGAAQWRKETEALLAEMKANVRLLESTYQNTHQIITQECEKLDQQSMATVKNVSQMLSKTKQDDLRKLLEEKSEELQNEVDQNLEIIQKTIYQFRWKNMGIALILSIIVAMIVSLYINDEWPWQAHQQVIKQRQAGEVLISSWKNLSEADKAVILQNA